MTTRFRRGLAALGLLVAAALAAPGASADGFFPTGLALEDQRRLKAFDEARASAIEEAWAGGAPEDVATLEAVLAGEPVELTPAQMTGEWRCRVLKLGGLLPLTVYPDFRCRISEDGAGLRLEKLTGSQRTSGYFYDTPEPRLGYAGALSYSYESWIAYGDDPERNQVGYLIALSPDRMRLELPLPLYESEFDILELRR